MKLCMVGKSYLRYHPVTRLGSAHSSGVVSVDWTISLYNTGGADTDRKGKTKTGHLSPGYSIYHSLICFMFYFLFVYST